MFQSFLYALRREGILVSLNEWLSLMQALNNGLCHSSLVEFYYISRAVLVKSEADFDKFDLAFARYFKDVKTLPDIPDEIMEFLKKPEKEKDYDKDEVDRRNGGYDLYELQKMLEERLKEQKERHDHGTYWVGTGGTSVMGHAGYSPKGIRVGGESRHKTALQVAGERSFKDFRQDHILDSRQFQVAFRKLRQFSIGEDGPKTELNVQETIDETCNKGGSLHLVMERPRKNAIKLILLFDSGGSMYPYTKLCGQLFHAVNKSNHFRDLKVYYFHNCWYDKLYTTPACDRGHWIDTEWLFQNLGSEYRVIVVGDASMAPSELLYRGGNYYIGLFNNEPGLHWVRKMKGKYKRMVWLNPILEEDWNYTYGAYTIKVVREEVNMYELTIKGLEAALKKLLVYR